MAAGSLTTQLIVRVLDQASAPARAIAAALSSIKNAAGAVSPGNLGAATAGIRAAIEKNNAALEAQRGRLLEAAAGYLALRSAVQAQVGPASDFETIMEDISQKAEIGKDGMAKLRKEILGLSKDIGASATEVGKGFDYLLGQGMKAQDATKIMPAIMKTAVAYRATIEDVSKAGFAALDNLKVPAEKFELALNMMSRAGKEGAFELRDMASEFPSLTAAAAALEMKGTTAVARLAAVLQVARKGAGTSAEAANNVANLMQKIISPETTKKFKKMGLDVRAELKKVQKEGGDVFEMIANLTDKALKGDHSKLGDLFEDRQVQQALRPLLQQLKLYKEIRDKAMNPGDAISEDYKTRMKTYAAANTAFKASIERLQIAIGTALFPSLTKTMNAIAPIIERFTELADQFPELTRAILLTVNALIGLKIAMIAAGFAGGLLKGGLLAVQLAALSAARAISVVLARALAPLLGIAQIAALRFAMMAAAFRAGAIGIGGVLAGLGATLARAGFAFLALLNPIRLVGAALRFAFIATPIGAVVAAIAAAGLLIYNNWKGLGEMFSAFGKRIAQEFPGIEKAFDSVMEPVKQLWEWVSKLLGPIDESGQKWREFGTSAAEAVVNSISKVGELIAYLASLPGKIKEALGNAARLLYDWGAELIQGLIDGIKAKASELIGYVTGIGARIKAALGGGVSVGGGAPAGPSISGARAAGGPVTRGNSYLVGEKGPEIFTANRTGTIIPNGGGGGGGGATNVAFSPTLNFTVQGDADEIAEKVREELEDAAKEALRGVFADTGLRTA